MTELLSILYKLRIFTLDELSEALKGKVKSVEALLARYKQQGWIVAIRRNIYCMKDIASGLPVCDKYEIGSHLSPTACISYHTALEFHGLAHQPFISSTSDLNRMDNIKVSATEKADSLDLKPVVFDNTELGDVVSQLAAFYHVKVEYDKAESQHIRIFFNWDKTKTLKQNLEILNAFERIQITEVDGIIKVE